ncbi:MAG: hypothetical protein WBF84_12700 [Castellaniella sp.]|uniref:hypothetical protein n=1 Tax=Castellaniella sp. TaxID=1955812 RepID=UPI003C72FCF2
MTDPLNLDALIALAPSAVLTPASYVDPAQRDMVRDGAIEAARWLEEGPAYFADGGVIPPRIDATAPDLALGHALEGYLLDFTTTDPDREGFEEYVRLRFAEGFWWLFGQARRNLRAVQAGNDPVVDSGPKFPEK